MISVVSLQAQLTLRDTPFLAKRFVSGPPGPDSITNLWQWFKPDTLASSNNGDIVGRWPDSSGNSWDATQSTATNRPYWTNQGITTNFGCLYFDGELDYLSLINPGAWSNMFRNVGGGTLIAVASRQVKVGEFTVVYISQGDQSTVQRANIARGPTQNTPELLAAGTRLDADAPQAVSTAGKTNTWYYMLADFQWANSDLYFYTNGVLAASTTSFKTAGNTSDTPSLGGQIGYNLLNQTHKGWISEVIIYSRSLSSDERTTLNTYMTNKYGPYPW